MPEEKPTVKKTSFRDDMVDPAINKGAEMIRKLFGLNEGWQNRLNVQENNYNLGLEHFRRGNFSDAVFRFTLVTWLAPHNAKAWFYLGRSQLAEGKPALAIKSLKKSLSMQPGNEEAHYLLAVAGGKDTPVSQLPKSMPRALAQEHFDMMAEGYNLDQLETYGYQGHIALANSVYASFPEGSSNHNLLELGVGTGLIGVRLRPLAGQITGVDFSPQMLAQARALTSEGGTPIYDTLIEAEAHEFLRTATPQSYDVAVAGGLVSYIGNVQELVALVAKVLKPGGIFAFTADPANGQDFRFLPEAGRFGFSESYLQSLGTGAGFSHVKITQAEIYPEYRAWLCVFKK